MKTVRGGPPEEARGPAAASRVEALAALCTISRPGGGTRVQILVSDAGNPEADRYTALTAITRDRRMSWLDLYLVVLFLALIGLLVTKFRG